MIEAALSDQGVRKTRPAPCGENFSPEVCRPFPETLGRLENGQPAEEAKQIPRHFRVAQDLGQNDGRENDDAILERGLQRVRVRAGVAAEICDQGA